VHSEVSATAVVSDTLKKAFNTIPKEDIETTKNDQAGASKRIHSLPYAGR